jgi:hypothetical protein
MTWLRNRLQSKRSRTVAVALACVALVVAGAGLVAFISANSAETKARDMITKLAARDPSAGQYLASPSLAELADDMGLVGLPASVKVSVSDFRTESNSGASGFYARYTVHLSEKDGTARQYDQSLVVTPLDERLGVRFLQGAIEFNADGYFGTTGTTQEDLDHVLDDLHGGNDWLPGVSITATSDDVLFQAEDVITIVPTRLIGWAEIASPPDPGMRTVWTVTVTSNYHTVLRTSPATILTKDAVPARYNRGGLSKDAAIQAATTVYDRFAAAVEAGDVQTANSMLSSADTKLTASGLAAMKGQMTSGGGSDEPELEDTPSAIRVYFRSRDYAVNMAADGTWSMDSRGVIAARVPGDGRSQRVYAARYLPGAPFPSCTGKITIRLRSVDFMAGGYAYAKFSFAYANQNCMVGDNVTRATVGWKGNSGVVVNDGMTGASDAWLHLPEGVTPTARPIWIKFTRYETSDGHALSGSLRFSTK